MDDDSGLLSLDDLRGWTKELVDGCTDVELLDLVYRLLLSE